MGGVKALLDLPYSLVDGNTCVRCFGDRGIQNFIRKNSNDIGCDFCEDSGATSRKSCELNDVLDFMLKCIGMEWEDPAQHIPYETAEGGYLEGFTVDTSDLLDYKVEVEFQNDAIREAVEGAIELWQWARRDPFTGSRDENLVYDWKRFCQLIKEEARFVFLKHPASRSDEYAGGRVSDILQEIGDHTKKLRLVRTLRKGTKFFRARKFNSRKHFALTVKELGPPPSDVSAKFPNRMSPPGIPMFYGALTEDTALVEIADSKPGKAAIAEFETLKELRVVDLTKVGYVPSVFEQDRYHMRSFLLFFSKFMRDFSAPVSRLGREHVDYIPTQVVTEYYRHIFKQAKKSVDGVLYPCSKGNGVSCVLFFNGKHCVEKGAALSKSHVLMFDGGSVRKVKIKATV